MYSYIATELAVVHVLTMLIISKNSGRVEHNLA